MLRQSEGWLAGVPTSRVAYRAWEMPDARAALLVVHGLGEHSGRYTAFGESMATSGVSTFALDLPGHGLSSGRRGHVPRFDVFLQTVDRLRREVDARTRSRVPLFLLGQSMGGLIVLRYLQDWSGRFHGAVIAAPWLATAMPVPRWKVAAARVLTRILPWAPFRHGIDPAALSRDTDIVAAYRADPLVHRFITPRSFHGAATTMRTVLERGDHIRDPVLFLIPGDDRVVDSERSLHFARSIASTDATIRVYPGHFHELLNEPDRARRCSEISGWILART